MIKKFNNDGFVVIKKLYNTKEILFLINEIKKIKNQFKLKKNQKYFHQTIDKKFNTIHHIQKFYKYEKILNIIKKKELILILDEIIGKNFKLRNIEFFLKPKKTGMASPFHQDNFYWNLQQSKGINVWIALNESNNKNGGVTYLKGSHKNRIYNHEISKTKGTSQTIPQKTLKNFKFKSTTPSLKKGDCIVHHCKVIHGSKKNNSKNDRIGLAISFQNKYEKINKVKMKLYKEKLKRNLKFIN